MASAAPRKSLTRRPPIETLPAGHVTHTGQSHHYLPSSADPDYSMHERDPSLVTSYQREPIISPPPTAGGNPTLGNSRALRSGTRSDSDPRSQSHHQGHSNEDFTSGGSLTYDEIDARLSSLTQLVVCLLIFCVLHKLLLLEFHTHRCFTTVSYLKQSVLLIVTFCLVFAVE